MNQQEMLEILKELVQSGEITSEEYNLFVNETWDGELSNEELDILRSTFSDANIKLILDFFKNYKDGLKEYRDVVGDNLVPDKVFFPIMIKYFGYLLGNDPEKIYSKHGVVLRRMLNPLVKAIGGSMLKSGQVIENRNYLLNDDNKVCVPEDKGVILPKEPVICCFNHSGFKDDILATILAHQRHGYLFMASLPQFFNTLDGLTAWLNGVGLFNRKVKESRQSFIPKGKKVISYGADVYMAPEGIWNKTVDKPSLDLWRGAYVLSCETGALALPMVHYLRDKNGNVVNNPIHTVVDEPIALYNLPEQAALNYLRDVLATWYSLMMEKYGKSTKEKELKGFSCWQDAQMSKLKDSVATVDRYDSEIETCGDVVIKQKNHDVIMNTIRDYLSVKNRDEDSKKDWFLYIKELLAKDEEFADLQITSDEDLEYLIRNYIRVSDRPETAFLDIANLEDSSNLADAAHASVLVRQRKNDNTQRRI